MDRITIYVFSVIRYHLEQVGDAGLMKQRGRQKMSQERLISSIV